MRRGREALALGVLLLGAGCAAGATPAGAPAAAEAEIVRALEISAERWNEGDLAGFLEPYLDSPATTFVGGGEMIRGKDAVEARYRASYWKDGTPPQTLRFAGLEVRPLGSDHALVTGRYQLFDPGGTRAAEGPFSLVLARTPQGWKIIHDHSS